MTKHPTKPNQRCKVIGGRSSDTNEGNSPNKGKVVFTMYLHQQQADDRVPVWHCKGKDLFTFYGNGTEADFLNYWLEVIDDEPEPLKADSTHLEKVTNE